MYHKISVTVKMRFLAILLCAIHLHSYAMDKELALNSTDLKYTVTRYDEHGAPSSYRWFSEGDEDDFTQGTELVRAMPGHGALTLPLDAARNYEMHPLIFPDIQRSNLSLKNFYETHQDSILHGFDTENDPYNVNAKCGLGLGCFLENKPEEGLVWLQKAAQENSSWAQYYLGLDHLIHGEIDPACDYFKQAVSQKIPGVPPTFYRHIMAMVGFESNPQFNQVTMFDKMLCAKAIQGDLAYPLAFFARRNSDKCAATIALEKAIQHQNNYYARALNDYGCLQYSNNQIEESLHCFDKAIENGSTKAVVNKNAVLEYIEEQKRKKEESSLSKVSALTKADTQIELPKNKIEAPKICADSDLTEIYAVAAQQYNNSQYILLLQNQAAAGDPAAQRILGLYYIDNPSDKKKFRTQEGWEWLQKAADQNDPLACYALSERGFESGDLEKRKKIAEYIDQLFIDRINHIELTAEQKGKMYANRGMYAVKINDETNACIYLEKAIESGDTTHTALLKQLQEKRLFNDTLSAQIKKYGFAQTPTQKSEHLNKIIQLMHNDAGNDISGSIADDAMLAALHNDAQSGSAEASYILGFCEQRGWSADNNGTDSSKVFEFYTKALESASITESLKNNCMEQLRFLSKQNFLKATLYIRKNYPTDDEKIVDVLYALANPKNWQGAHDALQVSSSNEIAVLKNDAKMGNEIADYLLGLKFSLDGISKDDKIMLEESVKYLQKAKKKLGHVPEYAIAKLEGRTLYALACREFNNDNNDNGDDKKAQKYCKEAADLGWFPACHSMYHLCIRQKDVETAKAYLKIAVDNEYLPAVIEDTLIRFVAAVKNKASVEEFGPIVEAFLKSTNLLEEDDKDALAMIYELKAGLCKYHGDRATALEWLGKAVDAGSHLSAIEVALDRLKRKDYAGVKKALGEVRGLDEHDMYVLLDAFLEYKAQVDDVGKRNVFFNAYQNYLKYSDVNTDQDGIKKDIYTCLAGEVLPSIQNDADAGDKEAQHGMALYYHGNHEHKDLKKSYEYAQKAGATLAYGLLADFYFNGHGVCEKDVKKAFEVCIAGLSSESSKFDMYKGRQQLCMIIDDRVQSMLRDRLDINLDATSAAHLSKIYLDIDSEKDRPNADINNCLLSFIPTCLSAIYYEKKEIEKLRYWCLKIPNGEINVNKPRYEALLHQHNALTKGKIVDAGQNAMKCLIRAAQLGDPVAQADLVKIFSMGTTFACGAKVIGNPDHAFKWAEALINNGKASAQHKINAYIILGAKAQVDIKNSKTKPALKNAAYHDGKSHYQAAIDAGEYSTLIPYLQLCNAMNDKDHANALYAKYGGSDQKIWAKSEGALHLIKEMLEIDTKYTKSLLHTFLTKAHNNKAWSETPDLTSYEKFIMGIEVFNKTLPDAANGSFEKYGFSSQEEAQNALVWFRTIMTPIMTEKTAFRKACIANHEKRK